MRLFIILGILYNVFWYLTPQPHLTPNFPILCSLKKNNPLATIYAANILPGACLWIDCLLYNLPGARPSKQDELFLPGSCQGSAAALNSDLPLPKLLPSPQAAKGLQPLLVWGAISVMILYLPHYTFPLGIFVLW